MASAWKDLDNILRGEATRPSKLRGGVMDIGVGRLAIVLCVLAMIYGVCMGSYSLLRQDGPSPFQWLATTLKVPALFFLTLVVTLPSLYVSNALVGSRLSLVAVVRLLTACLGVIVAVLASLGPIVAFFSVSTRSYPFILLLNVATFAVSGVLGTAFLFRTLHRLNLSRSVPDPTEFEEIVGESKAAESSAETSQSWPTLMRHATRESKAAESPASTPGALEAIDDQSLSRHVKVVFRCWIVLFGLVGAQMGWVLRPFVGAPDRPFVLFRARESSFFEAVWHAVMGLFS